MPTVEAAQCKLGDLGVVLYPLGPTGVPPEYINDEDIAAMELRIFPKHNELGRLFIYERHEQSKRWYHTDG